MRQARKLPIIDVDDGRFEVVADGFVCNQRVRRVLQQVVTRHAYKRQKKTQNDAKARTETTKTKEHKTADKTTKITEKIASLLMNMEV